MKKEKNFYRRKLPHIQPRGATFFVTFRLYDSIPYAELKRLQDQYERQIDKIKREASPFKNKLIYDERMLYFEQYDLLLDKIKQGPVYLGKPEIAEVVIKELKRFDRDFYDLICYCIMSNHVHILIDTSLQIPNNVEDVLTENFQYIPLDKIMKRVKGPSAVYANRLLGRSGKFWERESFDVYIRNEKHFNKVIEYILMNPVKAGLVKEWDDWEFSYFKYG